MDEKARVVDLPWIAGLPADLRDDLIAGGRVQRRAAGAWVYGEGDEDTGIVGVLEGSVYLHAQAPGGREALISLLPEGAVIGQSRLFGGGPRLVTAVCATDAVLFLAPDSLLRALADRQPALWPSLSRLVYAQLRTIIATHAEAIALPPRERLIARLLALSALANPIRCPQSALAEMVGVSRKAANDWLGDLAADELIERGYGWVRVADRRRLQRRLETS